MNTFGIKVVREDEYKIEVDPAVWDKKRRDEFQEVFWPVPELEDVAKSLAGSITKQGTGSFYEGFGHVVTFENGREISQYKTVNSKLHKREKEDYCPGIVVYVIAHDDEYDVELLSEESCHK